MRTLRNMAMIAMMFFMGCMSSASESTLVVNPTFVACGVIMDKVIVLIIIVVMCIWEVFSHG